MIPEMLTWYINFSSMNSINNYHKIGNSIFFLDNPIQIENIFIPHGYMFSANAEQLGTAGIAHQFLCDTQQYPKSKCNKIFIKIAKQENISWFIRIRYLFKFRNYWKSRKEKDIKFLRNYSKNQQIFGV